MKMGLCVLALVLTPFAAHAYDYDYDAYDDGYIPPAPPIQYFNSTPPKPVAAPPPQAPVEDTVVDYGYSNQSPAPRRTVTCYEAAHNSVVCR
ncbi:hypothetical protein [Pseudomonas marincola]|uniref:hypothetical protein n=1 Tax=Pseudomonas marincola TaxID=437900 RepID=UPI0008DF8DF6|nr:hypothetical protein [Pseudomonas marincola]SFT78055.1 hypothetical protein SAMN05216264_10488 [Pseudomonas marincola]